MAAGRSLKALVSRRRRVGDEGEDEEGPVMVEDSQSEGSVLSEPDDEEDVGSGDGEMAQPDALSEENKDDGMEHATSDSKTMKKTRKARKKPGKKSKDEKVTSASGQQGNFKATADTEAMQNGLHMDQQSRVQDATDFESLDLTASASVQNDRDSRPVNGHLEFAADKQKREFDEHRPKRETDPTFIPNRGNFFMHDTRGHQNGQATAPLRNTWHDRTRGKPGPGTNDLSVLVGQPTAGGPTTQVWKHDLHETINEELPASLAPENIKNMSRAQTESNRLFPKPPAPQGNALPTPRSFSSTKLLGNVQIRVSFPGLASPLVFSDVPWKHYTQLPIHRPPLRRDKPVRTSFFKSRGDAQPYVRYIFPSNERSFIFIPRQMRPNQSLGRGNNNQRSVGGYGYSSRRTSMYGGSMYSASVAASRRSSIAGLSRENAFSPVGSSVALPSSRPIVRLPHGGQALSAVSTPAGPLSGQHTPTLMPQIHSYPLPQQPTFQGTPTTTVHQPRPQKAISVTGIEKAPVTQEMQPFQNQLPAHIHEQQSNQGLQHAPPYFSPRMQYHYPQIPQAGTPLSRIPEQVMSGPSYGGPQPLPYGQAQYYPYYPSQPNFYHPSPSANSYHHVPLYVPPQPSYGLPIPELPTQQQAEMQPELEQQSHGHQQQSSQSGMVAHESNGMVFYVPASEAQQSEQYQPAEGFVPSYAMPGLPPPTPAPEHAASYYYHPMPPAGMQPVGSGVYYPPQPPQ